MTEAGLRSQDPDGNWRCLDGLLFFGPSMARRAVDLASRSEPQVVVIHLTSRQIIDETVTYAVLQRSPRLFPAFQSLSDLWRRLAGGQQEGTAGVRGLIFRAPKWLAVQLIGARPQVEIEDAVEWTLETLEALIRTERCGVVCKLPDLLLPARRVLPRHRARIERIKEIVNHFAAERHIGVVDRTEEILDAAEIDAGRDQRYSGIGLKRAEAALLAKAILDAGENLTP